MSATTMTTSSPNPTPAPSPGDAQQLAAAMQTMAGAMSFVPDAELLQGLANELFKQEPQAQASQFQPGAETTGKLPVAPPAGVSGIDELEAGKVPAVPGPSTAASLPHFNMPALPGLALTDFTQTAAFTGDTPFYFLAPQAPQAKAPAADNQPAPVAQGQPPILNSRFTLPPVQDLTFEDFTRPPNGAGNAALYFMDEAFRNAGVSADTRKQAGGGGEQLKDAFKQAREDVAPRQAQPAKLASAPGMFDVYSVRRDFPILQTRVHGKPLVWLDNGATSQKPQAVIDRLAHFYTHENSNVHRAAHTLAGRSTDAYEAAREKVRRFVNAGSTREIVWVRGANEGINLVAQTWGKRNLGSGDEILVTHLEHHANIVPWQMLCTQTGAKLCVAPVDNNGDILLQEFERLISPRTKLAAITAVSNALGTVTPLAQMIEIAHRHGVKVLVDGAQSVMHKRTDVKALDADWFVFSGHKVFAPTGIGAVYGKQELLDAAPPWQGGGNMIADVTFERTIYQPAPGRFEAGTGNIADAVGLGAAVDYLDSIGLENIQRHEHELMEYLLAGLRSLPIRIIGEPKERAGVVSFVSTKLRPEEIGQALDREGIAVRAGHHCAQPILRRFGVEASVRPSLALYNTCEDIDALINALRRILK